MEKSWRNVSWGARAPTTATSQPSREPPGVTGAFEFTTPVIPVRPMVPVCHWPAGGDPAVGHLGQDSHSSRVPSRGSAATARTPPADVGWSPPQRSGQTSRHDTVRGPSRAPGSWHEPGRAAPRPARRRATPLDRRLRARQHLTGDYAAPLHDDVTYTQQTVRDDTGGHCACRRGNGRRSPCCRPSLFRHWPPPRCESGRVLAPNTAAEADTLGRSTVLDLNDYEATDVVPGADKSDDTGGHEHRRPLAAARRDDALAGGPIRLRSLPLNATTPPANCWSHALVRARFAVSWRGDASASLPVSS